MAVMLLPHTEYGHWLAGLAGIVSYFIIQAARPQICVIVVAGLLGLGAYSFLRARDELTFNNTAYDFMKASAEIRSEFTQHMCSNGGCLPIRDWRCGFSNGGDIAVARCVEKIMVGVEPWEKLDKIVKYCGSTHADFVNTLHSTPADCKKAGGVWGMKSTPSIEWRIR